MGMSPLYDLLFESVGSVTVGSRIPLDKSNCEQISGYAREVREQIQSTVDVIASLTASAKSRKPPTEDLEAFASQVIDDLHQFVRALDEFSDLTFRISDRGFHRG